MNLSIQDIDTGDDPPEVSVVCCGSAIHSSSVQATAVLQAAEVAAAKKLATIVTQDVIPGDYCPVCHQQTRRSEDLQARVSFGILDRTGHGPQAKVEVSQAPDTQWMSMLTDDQLATLEGWINEARAKLGTGAITS